MIIQTYSSLPDLFWSYLVYFWQFIGNNFEILLLIFGITYLGGVFFFAMSRGLLGRNHF